jgi:hypothetical protein
LASVQEYRFYVCIEKFYHCIIIYIMCLPYCSQSSKSTSGLLDSATPASRHWKYLPSWNVSNILSSTTPTWRPMQTYDVEETLTPSILKRQTRWRPHEIFWWNDGLGAVSVCLSPPDSNAGTHANQQSFT